ncbi:hypothetical protein AB6N24_03385 [Cellulomonas sp. 179-A 4D5 NHS]|uniref:hypothetical protein n=1 Tax=Cellulomonas sp. 179-A 4D5 NHS TaxID=3142378 RepID=UPI00399FAE9D
MHPVGEPARRVAGVLGPVLVALGLLAAVVGVATTADATQDASGTVAVPVRLGASDGTVAPLGPTVDGEAHPGVRLSGVPTGGLPMIGDDASLPGVVTLHAPDATLTEQVLSRADVLLRGLAVLVGAFALRPVLRLVAAGRPLRPWHERHLHVVAACVVLGGYVGPLLPWVATASVLGRLHGADGLSAAPPHHLEAFVVAALVVLVAAGARAGASGPSPDPRVWSEQTLVTASIDDASGEVRLQDATWQDQPEFRPGDTWVAFWGESLVADAAPFPGVAVRTLDVADQPGGIVHVDVTRERPRDRLHHVAGTTLVVGDHGMVLEAGSMFLRVPVPAGSHPCEIWVDARRPFHVSHVAIVLGPHRPRPRPRHRPRRRGRAATRRGQLGG